MGAVGGGLQDMAPPLRELKELSSLKWLSLILRPILPKSAADTFTGQFKTLIDSNNFTVLTLNVYFAKCIVHKKKSCVNFGTFPFIHAFSCGL